MLSQVIIKLLKNKGKEENLEHSRGWGRVHTLRRAISFNDSGFFIWNRGGQLETILPNDQL